MTNNSKDVTDTSSNYIKTVEVPSPSAMVKESNVYIDLNRFYEMFFPNLVVFLCSQLPDKVNAKKPLIVRASKTKPSLLFSLKNVITDDDSYIVYRDAIRGQIEFPNSFLTMQNDKIQFYDCINDLLKRYGWTVQFTTDSSQRYTIDSSQRYTITIIGSLTSQISKEESTAYSSVKQLLYLRNQFITYFNDELKKQLTSKSIDNKRLNVSVSNFAPFKSNDPVINQYYNALIQGFCFYINLNTQWDTIWLCNKKTILVEW